MENNTKYRCPACLSVHDDLKSATKCRDSHRHEIGPGRVNGESVWRDAKCPICGSKHRSKRRLDTSSSTMINYATKCLKSHPIQSSDAFEAIKQRIRSLPLELPFLPIPSLQDWKSKCQAAEITFSGKKRRVELEIAYLESEDLHGAAKKLRSELSEESNRLIRLNERYERYHTWNRLSLLISRGYVIDFPQWKEICDCNQSDYCKMKEVDGNLVFTTHLKEEEDHESSWIVETDDSREICVPVEEIVGVQGYGDTQVRTVTFSTPKLGNITASKTIITFANISSIRGRAFCCDNDGYLVRSSSISSYYCGVDRSVDWCKDFAGVEYHDVEQFYFPKVAT